MDQIHLFVTTRGRGTDLRIFDSLYVDQLAKEQRLGRITICVVKEEAPLWTGHPLVKAGVELLVLPANTRLEAAKQRILDEAGYIHVVVDDDLGIRRRTKNGQIRACTYEDVLDLFRTIVKCVKDMGYFHGGISACQVHNAALESTPTALLENTRCGGFAFYVPEVLRKHKIDYTQANEAEDMHAQLTLLKKGVKNVQLWEWCYDQKTQAKGGCSTYRTVESVRQAALNLQKLHPDCIKLTEKFSKTWNAPVYSIMAYYKRAYKQGAAGASLSTTKEQEEQDDSPAVVLAEEEEEKEISLFSARQVKRRASRSTSVASATSAEMMHVPRTRRRNHSRQQLY